VQSRSHEHALDDRNISDTPNASRRSHDHNICAISCWMGMRSMMEMCSIEISRMHCGKKWQ